MKVAILFGRFGPYHIARISGAMAQMKVLAVEGAPHRTLYGWAPPEPPEGLEYCRLTRVAGEDTDTGLIEQRLEELILPLQPDAIAICGWATVIDLVTLRWCARKGIPAICMSETNEWDFKRYWLTEKVKRGIMEHYSSGLATNDSQVGYIANLGLPKEKVMSGYNAVDNRYFREAATKWRAEQRLPLEIAGTVPEAANGRYFLASNSFIPKKNLARLIDAYAAFRRGRDKDLSDWPLVLLGDGELRADIEAQIERLGLQCHVHLPGFLQVEALPRYYATAGAFIHASTTEQWGLVVNEAMASGLPVAVSNRCGATEFLIEDGVTGYSFDPFKLEEITRSLTMLASLPKDTQLLEAAAAKVEELSPEKFGEGLAAAARTALDNPASPGFLARRALDFAILRLKLIERS